MYNVFVLMNIIKDQMTAIKATGRTCVPNFERSLLECFENLIVPVSWDFSGALF